ncbi:hypothetical protein B0I27_1054 [Arcticibacter pallidicorallinus]|uniref:Uncharacterized protein n=2 Tax=Arcticibacter pallidicorallinus TaxID=1259464 RepID=A0A2T0U3V0_9SPHI|nr:hypothetical protein B0I27_1054 [Arcticibacter pallidicorallinus]
MDWAFKLNLKYYNIKYSAPEGFSHLDSMTSSYCLSNRSELFQYSLINKEEDIAIRFLMIQILPQTAEQLERTRRLFNLKYVTLPNDNYLRTIYLQLEGDTANRIVYYPKSYAKKTFNVNVAGEYDRECKLIYKDKFYKSKVVFLHRENKLDCFIHYFYEEGKEEKVREIIAKTRRMFRLR